VADVSVRPAGVTDAGEIGHIQLMTWQVGYARILPPTVLAELSANGATEQAAASWREAITAPPSRRHHVLVALEKQELVGFVAVAPAEDLEASYPDPDAAVQLGPLLVEPRWGRRGHGSRLVAAAIDHARGDGATSAIIWLPEGDQASRSFFTSAGWAPDGYARGLDTGAGELREIRLHTDLSAPDADTPVGL
jgi:GNAT superfamily N-acetyltransferase